MLISGRLIALLVVLTFLTGRIGAVSYHTFVEPIQDYISKRAIVDEESNPKTTILFKGKRCSSELLSTTVSSIPDISPLSLATRFPVNDFRGIPEVYLDIFIPPDPQAA